MATPTDVLHEKRRNVLRIAWDDGAHCDYPIPYLRGWCPCAGCQGHGGVIRFREAHDVRADAIAEVGSYALSFRFSDGHDTGIYTWTWLRRLAPDMTPEGLKQGYFSDNRFHPPIDASPGGAENL
jgi:DUF971 family protein